MIVRTIPKSVSTRDRTHRQADTVQLVSYSSRRKCPVAYVVAQQQVLWPDPHSGTTIEEFTYTGTCDMITLHDTPIRQRIAFLIR